MTKTNPTPKSTRGKVPVDAADRKPGKSTRQEQLYHADFRVQTDGGRPEDYLHDENTVRHYAKGKQRGGKVVAEYIYLDEHGEEYLKVERTEDKQFPQSHWDPGNPMLGKGGRWKYGTPRGPKIPYLLPFLIKAAPD